jgi:hypothetical protein
MEGKKISYDVEIKTIFLPFFFFFLNVLFFFLYFPTTSTRLCFYLPSFVLFFMSHKRYFSTPHRTFCPNPLNFLFHYCRVLRS